VNSCLTQDWQANAPDHNTLDCDRNDQIFPLRVRLTIATNDQPESIGWLLLGPRPDGSFFGKDERDALASVAGPIARAIRVAELRGSEAERRRNETAPSRRTVECHRALVEARPRQVKTPEPGRPAPVEHLALYVCFGSKADAPLMSALGGKQTLARASIDPPGSSPQLRPPCATSEVPSPRPCRQQSRSSGC